MARVSEHNTEEMATPAIWQAGKAILSLALMDARNRSLLLFTQIEALWQAGVYPIALASQSGLAPPQITMQALAQLQTQWVDRNEHRFAGQFGLPAPAPLPQSDGRAVPSFEAVKVALLESLEVTLEWLDKADGDADSLYLFRQCLAREDAFAEDWLGQAQMLGLPVQMPPKPTLQTRAAITLPGQQWLLGSASGEGYVPAIEQPAHSVYVGEFEIDAQPVTWAQYAEFVDDGGYDNPAWWHVDGWQRYRAPRYVDHIGRASGAVTVTEFGKSKRLASGQSVCHISWWEADAFARWMGRRLPDEAEWEIAAYQAAHRGWRWGDVLEWTASRYRPYPGYRAACDADPQDAALFGAARTVRGASFATHDRLRLPKRRRGALPGRDDLFIGFRTCAL